MGWNTSCSNFRNTRNSRNTSDETGTYFAIMFRMCSCSTTTKTKYYKCKAVALQWIGSTWKKERGKKKETQWRKNKKKAVIFFFSCKEWERFPRKGTSIRKWKTPMVLASLGFKVNTRGSEGNYPSRLSHERHKSTSPPSDKTFWRQ